MKKCLFLTGILACALVFGTGIAHAQTVSLDAAIKGVADDFSYNLKRGSKVAILSMRVNSGRMSNYLIEELTSVLVNQRMVTVVDRAQLDLIQEEMKFQMSGEVSDSSAQAIGRKLGATAIITGSFEPLGGYYRFRVRVVEVETAAILVTYSANVHSDQVVASLMGGQSSVPAPAQAQAAPSSPQGSGSKQGSASATSYPNGLNFSTGRKVGAGFLNLIFGIGSFTMGDIAGGIIGAIIPTVGITLGLVADYAETKKNDNGEEEKFYPYDWMLVPAYLCLFAAHPIYSFIRPFAYDKNLAKKNGTYYAAEEANPLYHISFGPVPTRTGLNMGVMYGVSY